METAQRAGQREREEVALIYRGEERQLRAEKEQLEGELRELQIMTEQDKAKYDAEIAELGQKLREVRELVAASEQQEHAYKQVTGKIAQLRQELRLDPGLGSPLHGRVLNMSDALTEPRHHPARLAALSPRASVSLSPGDEENLAMAGVLDEAL